MKEFEIILPIYNSEKTELKQGSKYKIFQDENKIGCKLEQQESGMIKIEGFAAQNTPSLTGHLFEESALMQMVEDNKDITTVINIEHEEDYEFLVGKVIKLKIVKEGDVLKLWYEAMLNNPDKDPHVANVVKAYNKGNMLGMSVHGYTLEDSWMIEEYSEEFQQDVYKVSQFVLKGIAITGAPAQPTTTMTIVQSLGDCDINKLTKEIKQNIPEIMKIKVTQDILDKNPELTAEIGTEIEMTTLNQSEDTAETPEVIEEVTPEAVAEEAEVIKEEITPEIEADTVEPTEDTVVETAEEETPEVSAENPIEEKTEVINRIQESLTTMAEGNTSKGAYSIMEEVEYPIYNIINKTYQALEKEGTNSSKKVLKECFKTIAALGQTLGYTTVNQSIDSELSEKVAQHMEKVERQDEVISKLTEKVTTLEQNLQTATDTLAATPAPDKTAEKLIQKDTQNDAIAIAQMQEAGIFINNQK